jgi:hypothetical protein
MREAFQFSVILSEVCQNIIEHAEAGGWVATQTYNWTKKVGRKVVVIAVMDLGIGFRASLAGAHAARYERWDDAAALEAAFMHGQTRFHDPGRGQGIQQIRKQVGRWGGRISIRSGTARIADVPAWDEGRSRWSGTCRTARVRRSASCCPRAWPPTPPVATPQHGRPLMHGPVTSSRSRSTSRRWCAAPSRASTRTWSRGRPAARCAWASRARSASSVRSVCPSSTSRRSSSSTTAAPTRPWPS